MIAKTTIGFIGLGVMGEPMCRHLVQKSGSQVVIHDINAEPVARLVTLGARDGGTVAEVAKADVVFISLPEPIFRKYARVPVGCSRAWPAASWWWIFPPVR